MSSDCDTCGLEDAECNCYVYELEKRIEHLENGLDELANVVNSMSSFIKERLNEQ